MSWGSTKNPKIREIIKILGESGSKTPKQLAEKMNLHEVVVSRYLRILKNDNLLKIKREQNTIHYSLNQTQWKKHIEATIALAGDNFAKKFNKRIETTSHPKSNKNASE